MMHLNSLILPNKTKLFRYLLPTIELVSKGEKIVDEFLESIKKYAPDYSVFMSSKAVKLLFDTARHVGKLEALQLAVANTIVMSVGPKTTISAWKKKE